MESGVADWGYRFRQVELYNHQEWLSFDFPQHPAKFYVSKLQLDWDQKQYTTLRLVDTGGIDYWQGGVHYWHSKVIFLGALPVEVNFSSTGRAQRGQGEVFDYAQVEVKEARQLHEENGGDESWYSFQHTFSLAGAMSYHDIVAAVAAMAWEYPYFTWDEAGTFETCGHSMGIKESHCRIFAERLLRQLVAIDELAKIPVDMDVASRLPNVLRVRQDVKPCAGPRLLGDGDQVAEELSPAVSTHQEGVRTLGADQVSTGRQRNIQDPWSSDWLEN